MVDSIEWLRSIIFQYHSFEYLVIVFSAAFGGEIALFALGFFVAQGVLPLFPVIIFGFLGAFTPNILWFLLGRTNTIEVMVSHRYVTTTIVNITKAIERASRGNHFTAL